MWKTWHPNGALKGEGTFRDDAEDGHFVYYFTNGKKAAEGDLSKGLNVREWTFWYDNGQMKRRGTIGDDNQPVGKWTCWYDNGALQQEGYMKNGKEEGTWTAYSRDGTQVRSMSHMNGVEQK